MRGGQEVKNQGKKVTEIIQVRNDQDWNMAMRKSRGEQCWTCFSSQCKQY